MILRNTQMFVSQIFPFCKMLNAERKNYAKACLKEFAKSKKNTEVERKFMTVLRKVGRASKF